MPDRFQWMSDGTRRHGVPAELAAGDTGTALCGASITMPELPLSRTPGGCAPTCHLCDVEWRKATGIPLRRAVVDVEEPPPDLPTPRTPRSSARPLNGARS